MRATGSILHLVKPLGFKIDDKHLKRAGLDYWKLLDIRILRVWMSYLIIMTIENFILPLPREKAS